MISVLIQNNRLQAVLAVNRELMLLCWGIGAKSYNNKHGRVGIPVIDRLATRFSGA